MHVQVHQRVGRHGLPEIFDQFAVEVADLGRRERDLKHQGIAAAQIEGRGDQRLFHRQREVAVAADARFVAQRLPQGLAEAMPTSSTVWC